MERLKNFIGGEVRASESDTTFPDVNPSDASDLIAEVPEGTDADVKAAVGAASKAGELWRSFAAPVRAEFLYRWADRVSAFNELLAQAVTREVGKPISEARVEATRCVSILRYYAGEAVHPSGEVIPAQMENALQFSLRGPLGVVGLITPWNFPLAIPVWKAAPALAFGNTVVWKASELSPYVSTLLANTAAEACLPSGVFNLVVGTGEAVGAPLLQATEVRGVSFTGSARVGAQVAAIASGRGIRYQTEMGGKNCAIVLKDADLERAAKLIAGGAMRYAGQKCTATSRAIVAKEIVRPFAEKLEAAVRELPLGPVVDPRAAIGPVISDASWRRLQQIRMGVKAARVFEVPLPCGREFAKGFFSPPTVVYGAEPDSEVGTTELFGPVLAVFEADDLDHAIALANGTPFGLSATLFTSDIKSALSYVRRIDAGMVRVNGDTTGVDPHAPFGGMKGSSSGSREQGTAAREFYTELKTVQIQG